MDDIKKIIQKPTLWLYIIGIILIIIIIFVVLNYLKKIPEYYISPPETSKYLTMFSDDYIAVVDESYKRKLKFKVNKFYTNSKELKKDILQTGVGYTVYIYSMKNALLKNTYEWNQISGTDNNGILSCKDKENEQWVIMFGPYEKSLEDSSNRMLSVDQDKNYNIYFFNTLSKEIFPGLGFGSILGISGCGIIHEVLPDKKEPEGCYIRRIQGSDYGSIQPFKLFKTQN